MSAQRKTPVRTKAFTARSTLSVLVAAAGDVTKPAAAPPQRSVERVRGDAAQVKAAPRPQVSGEERHRMIAKVAYDYAERANFVSDPLSNWLTAEREIDSMLARMAS